MKNNKKCKKVLYDAVPGAGTIQLKIICFMTKPDVISTIDDFYFSECHLIIAKFYEKSEYVKFLNFGPLIKSPQSIISSYKE